MQQCPSRPTSHQKGRHRGSDLKRTQSSSFDYLSCSQKSLHAPLRQNTHLSKKTLPIHDDQTDLHQLIHHHHQQPQMTPPGCCFLLQLQLFPLFPPLFPPLSYLGHILFHFPRTNHVQPLLATHCIHRNRPLLIITASTGLDLPQKRRHELAVVRRGRFRFRKHGVDM